MTESVPDFAAQISSVKRKMRMLKRDIMGTSTAGQEALVQPENTYLFESKLEAAREDWKEFRIVFEEFCAIHDAMGEEDFPTEEWQTYYDGVKEEIDQSEAVLLRIKRQQRQQAPLPNAQAGNESTLSHSFTKAHLPKIAIPEFNGDLKKWTHFKDTYLSLIHNEPSLSNVERFHYLLSSLKGEAASIISRIPIEERTYSQAWEKLLSTYDNPRILATMFLKRILECNITSFNSPLERYETFMTNVADSIEGFVSLELEDPMDFILSVLALRALDPQSRQSFETSLDASKQIPRADDVIKFVRSRLNAIKLSNDFQMPSESYLPAKSSNWKGKFPNRSHTKFSSSNFHAYGRVSPEACELQSSDSDNKGRWKQRKQSSWQSSSPQKSSDRRLTCPLCNEGHSIFFCFEFQKLSPEQRLQLVEKWKSCKNCLKTEHNIDKCPSRWNCKFCKKRHHSLLHVEVQAPKEVQQEAETPSNSLAGFESDPPIGQMDQSTVLLGTIQMFIRGSNNQLYLGRGILDTGSQHTFITHPLALKLGLPMKKFSSTITGLGGSTVAKPHGSTNLTLRSCQNCQEIQTQAVVVDRISPLLPSQPLPSKVIKRMSSLKLADETFGRPGNIDILLGVDIYPSIITGVPTKANVDNLYLIPTIFGLAVIGKTVGGFDKHLVNFFAESSSDIDSQLKKFWEIEEPTAADRSNPEDVIVEEHFLRTHTRTSTGRYVVELPIREELKSPGDNKDIAAQRFYALERKLAKNPNLLEKYKESIQDYIDQGHMVLASSPSDYIIPHHGVMQGQKLRVVFDGSCPSRSGKSLNDILLVGPRLQEDICKVLTRFRFFVVPLCSDIVKMYRQVLVHSRHRHLQHIYWRSSMDQPLMEYELLTVTWGLKPSGYLALRALLQLSNDEGSKYPLALRSINTNRFVDDIVTGADTVEDAIKLKKELVEFLGKGGFSLGKWATSHPEILEEEEAVEAIKIKDETDGSVKILGLMWNTKNDSFSYIIHQPPRTHITKRIILSCIAKIFDPLGFLAPVVFAAKTLLQDVWKAKIGWDDTLPKELFDEWNSLIKEWNTLSLIRIPRNVSIPSAHNQLIGFCDASTKGYAAAIYLRSENPDGNTKISLLKAKTKVAPTKFMSIARLELCGALLLSRTLESTGLENADILRTICFTDSQVVLDWLHTPSHLLKVFEANRVTQILSVVSLDRWHHIQSHSNPSDLASRGCTPQTMKDAHLWWNGPDWLKLPMSKWPIVDSPNYSVLSSIAQPMTNQTEEVVSDDWMRRFSSFRTLIRTVARILRLKPKRARHPYSSNKFIDAAEFNKAKICCVKVSQRAHFPPELFNNRSPIPKPIQGLSPFIDEAGIIRVGGRLQNAPISTNNMHPILIPRHSAMAPLIVDEIHKNHFHAGPSLCLSILRGHFWIPSAMKFIRSRIRQCVHCRINRAKPIVTKMAPLPESRFSQSRAFIQVGVDYAGPFIIKESNRRKASLSKAYLCLFVCMSTKAVHLEAVTSLSTAAFISALDRFTSRRGIPHTLWSDHGSNFIGASRFLKEVYTFIAKNEGFITEQLAPKKISWKFIPPRAPHFGGLWEAGVRSVKSLLTGSIGKSPATFEELATVLTRIEALLNSRPLAPLSEDVDEFTYLTPAHFMIGAPLSSLPEPNDDSETRSPSSRWRMFQQQIAVFWNRWRKEYLHRLQQSYRWHHKGYQLKIGDLVVMLERRGLVGTWPVGRIVDTHPGKDGIIRVVSVRTPSGNTLTRAGSTLAPLFHTEE